MAAHVYWRIFITAADGSVAAIAELRMYDATGTLVSTGGTASASSYYAPEGLVPANAFDNNASSTWWASNAGPTSGAPEWLAYQLPSAADVAVMIMTPRPLAAQKPITFKYQYSDNGSTWTDATSTISTNGTNWGTYRSMGTAIGTPATGAYVNWRLRITANTGGGSFSAAEIEFRGSVGGADLTSPSFPENTFVSGGSNDSPNGFDNNTSTLTSGPAPPQVVGYNFPKAVIIREISYTARNDAAANQSASAATVQASNDTLTWTDIDTLSFSSWSAGQTQVKSVAGPAAGGLLVHRGMEGGMKPLLLGGMNG